jgi:hypothetical protein
MPIFYGCELLPRVSQMKCTHTLFLSEIEDGVNQMAMVEKIGWQNPGHGFIETVRAGVMSIDKYQAALANSGWVKVVP